MMLIQSFPVQILIIAVTDCYCCTLDHVAYPFIETSVLPLSGCKRNLDSFDDRGKTGPIGFSIPRR